jgi:ferrous iron transport protein A
MSLVHIPASQPMPSRQATLAKLEMNQPHVVSAVAVPAHAPEWARWLEEIGFIPGERVTLVARGMLGGDPLVVRVGSSTFALRLAEAACVHVRSDPDLAVRP